MLFLMSNGCFMSKNDKKNPPLRDGLFIFIISRLSFDYFFQHHGALYADTQRVSAFDEI